MNSKYIAPVRDIKIGGDESVKVQTMYDDKISGINPEIVVKRINDLSLMGCDLIRFSYVSKEDGENFKYITSHSPIPVVADIHFD